MKKVLKVFDVILRPFHYIGSYRISEKVVNFFKKHRWALYVLTTLLTGAYIAFRIVVSKG